MNQKISIVTKERFKYSTNKTDFPPSVKKLEATKKPNTIGINFTGPSKALVKLLSN